MFRPPPRSILTYAPLPYPTLFRAWGIRGDRSRRRGSNALELAKIGRNCPAPQKSAGRSGRIGCTACRIENAEILMISRNGSSAVKADQRSEEKTSELQSLMRIPYAVFSLKKKNTKSQQTNRN